VTGNWNIPSSREKGTNWSRKPNDISWMLLSSHRLSVMVLIVLSWTTGGNFSTPAWSHQRLRRLDCRRFLNPLLANCVDECISLGGMVCMLWLKLLGRSLCLIQAYGPKSSTQYLEFVEESSNALRKLEIGFGKLESVRPKWKFGRFRKWFGRNCFVWLFGLFEHF